MEIGSQSCSDVRQIIVLNNVVSCYISKWRLKETQIFIFYIDVPQFFWQDMWICSKFLSLCISIFPIMHTQLTKTHSGKVRLTSAANDQFLND